MVINLMFLQQEEQDFGPEPVPGGIREYVNAYKTFSENFTTLLKLVMSDDLTQQIMSEVTNMADTLAQQITV